jgi:tRNA threonylcarbamoyladenosine biosynthesis protein TsaE
MEITYDINQIDQAAAWLFNKAMGRKCFAFHGEMGAGKTTFIHSFCKLLRVSDTISSPTFSIINEYADNEGRSVFHIDLYRLHDEREAIAAGVEDCIASDNYCFVEWPERAKNIFPVDTLHCNITVIDETTRNMKLIL